MEYSKILTIQDCYFVKKSTNHNNHEDTLRITSEMKTLISNYIQEGDKSFDVKLYKEDYIKSIFSIIRDHRQLKEKNPSKEISFDDKFLSKYLVSIDAFFKDVSFKNYTVTLRDNDHLAFSLVDGFSPRYFFVEERTKVAFKMSISNKLEMIVEYNSDFSRLTDISKPLQQIFYGAPGTGKSRGIKDQESKFDEVIRTTFHPDTDYSTFVGAYKPVVENVDVKVVPVVLNNGASFDQNNGTYKEKKITYKFVKQSFLKAYISAWNGLKSDKKVLLDIEEINRGNCAQIFGDIFQLLDREEEGPMVGYSTYPIEADEDIANLLKEEFKNSDIDLAYIKDGSKLLLPPNLYIWATMNTSDQSLFPIDSAFKRRWDWVYLPIEQPKIGKDARKWKIKADDHWCYWWEFLQAINQKIEDVVNSEDKQLGYFFTKPTDGEFIDANTFVNKVIFYLWNDVFKDEDCDCFVYKKSVDDWDVNDIILNDNTKLTFRKFISSRDKVDEKLVHWFINNLLKSEKIKKLDDDKQEVVNPGEIALMRKCSEDLKNDENLNK